MSHEALSPLGLGRNPLWLPIQPQTYKCRFCQKSYNDYKPLGKHERNAHVKLLEQLQKKALIEGITKSLNQNGVILARTSLTPQAPSEG